MDRLPARSQSSTAPRPSAANRVLASSNTSRASEAAWERAEQDPDAPVPSWTLYRLRPDEVEFFQGDERRRHVRLNYRRREGGWAKELLWP